MNLAKKILLVFFFIGLSFLADAQDGEDLNLLGEDVESPEETFVKKVKKLKARKLSDLVQLSRFSDIAVIQRRFMPKTGRVSASLFSAFNMTSEFFLHTGLGGHLNYNFLEKHGVELSSYYLWTFKRRVTVDLAALSANVEESVPIHQSFFGLVYKWMPWYGKMAFYDKSILAFDTFFSLGGGMSGIIRGKNGKIIWEPTAVVGLGQVFAITRDLGLRWDLRYKITIESQQNFNVLNNFLFSIGLSYYYPSAGLR
ncbi:MAG: outer membrane beta-barrel domain-containing protein [Oligoflexia bacterium]|nr:outer membrane beta-barrel domain-containing protein [Bdellovibrionales bacterium]MYE07140.1 outer membrane beta-barrel domain-containing protein [Oligoflexia bacterium]